MSRANIDISLNNEEAKARLREIAEELKKVKNLREQALEKGDASAFDLANKEMKKLEAESKKLSKEVFDVNKVLRNISSASIKDLDTAIRVTTRDLNAMNRTDPGYADKERAVRLLKNELNEANSHLRSQQNIVGRLADSFNKYFTVITAGAASFAGLILGGRKAVDTFNQYEKSVDNLSALTGLAGRDLEWLSQQAIEMSTATIEGNVRITSSAQAIVDAYTKVGSKRPDLLKVKEDLNSVTQEAMILSAAANGDLQPAVDGLTMVLNQFNAPASESRRIINVLAAGSKEGAGEVDYLTTAFEKSGSVAASLGISYEELTGIIETLAPRFSQPEMAGRSLRNIMIKLEAQSNNNLKPSLVGLGIAFENLAKQQLTITQLEKMFGEENITAANILMTNTAETKKYTEAVTGTNVALEQAAINTDNNQSKLDQARNRVQKLSIEFGEKLAPALTFSTNSFSYLMKAILAAPAFITRYQIALIALAGAMLAYNATQLKSIALKVSDQLLMKTGIGLRIKEAVVLQAMIVKEQLLTIWKGNGTVATKLATTAQYAWNAAVKANPIGLIIAAITALVVAIKVYDQTNRESVRLENEKKEALNSLKKSNDTLSSAYDVYAGKITELNKLSIEQKKALLEQTKATLENAEAELLAAKAKQEVIFKENTRLTLWQKMIAGFLGAQNPAASVAYKAAKALENGADAASEMNDGINALLDNIKRLKTQNFDLNETVNAESLADQITGKAVVQLEEKQRYLTTALKNYEKGSADYIRISKKLDQVNRELNKDGGGSGDGTEKQATAYEKLNKQIQELERTLADQVFRNDPKSAQTLKLLEEAKAKAEEVKAILESYDAASKVEVTEKSDKYFMDGLEDEINALIDKNEQENKIMKKKYDDQQKMYDNYLKDKERVDEDYQQRKDDLEKLAIDTSVALLSSASDLIAKKELQAIEDKYSVEEDRLSRQLDKNTISQEVYNQKMTQLRDKRAREEEKIERRNSIIKKTIAAIGIGADAAESIFKIKAMASELTARAAVIAITNPAIAAVYVPLIATVLGQIPMILASAGLQTAAVFASGMKSGGYADKAASDDTPVGIYHANEFIGNAESVRNPSVKKIYDVIDYAQKNGTVSRINLPAILEATSTLSGRKSGGYTSTVTSPNIIQPSSSSDNDRLNKLLEKLDKRLSEPIEASVALRGRKGLYEVMTEDETLSNNASL